MAWPCPQDYNEAIQTPKMAFSDQLLREAVPELNRFELPRAVSGGFASVYRMHAPAGDVAVRCFLRDSQDLSDRYQCIEKFLSQASLSCLVKVEYITNGIKVAGQFYPVLKMPWLDGETLDQYIWRNISKREVLTSLSAKFERLVCELRQHGVAHGDLQHGNILVVEDELVLVDYDGMYVPGLDGFAGNELGHRNYQHPLRCASDFGPQLDNFAGRAILSSLRCISEDPSLWEKLGGGDECLLFKDIDFKLPLLSRAFYVLEKHESELVRSQAAQLRSSLDCKPQDVPPCHVVIDTAHLVDIDAYTGFSGFWTTPDMEEPELPEPSRAGASTKENLSSARKLQSAPDAGDSGFEVLLNQGIYQAEIGHHEQAARYFIKALQIDPDSFDAYRNLGFAHLESNKAGIAVSNFSAALRINPNDAISLAGRSLAQREMKRFGLAQNDAEASLMIESANPLALRARATIRAELNQYQAALNDIEMALSIAPRDAQCYCARGMIRQKMGRHGPAIADFDAALQLKPTLGKAYYYRAVSQRELRQNSRAMEDLSMATKMMPSNADCHYSYGEVLLSLKHFDRAMEAFQSGLALDESNPQRAWLRMAELHWSRHDYSTAGYLFNRVAQRDSALLSRTDPSVIAVARGFRYFEEGNLDGALAVFDGVIQGRFPLPEAYLGRGQAFFRKRRYQEARDDFHSCAGGEELAAESLCWIAICNARLFDLSQALLSLSSVPSVCQDAPTYNYAVALLAIFNEQYSEALPYLRLCEAFEDSTYWIAVAEAMLIFQNGDYKKAARSLERCLDVKAESVVVAALSEVLIQLKRHKEAERYLQHQIINSGDRCPHLHYWRGVCLVHARKELEAESEFDQALVICSDYERARFARQSLVKAR